MKCPGSSHNNIIHYRTIVWVIAVIWQSRHRLIHPQLSPVLYPIMHLFQRVRSHIRKDSRRILLLVRGAMIVVWNLSECTHFSRSLGSSIVRFHCLPDWFTKLGRSDWFSLPILFSKEGWKQDKGDREVLHILHDHLEHGKNKY
ncbi:unnamed protein product [Toxocara canis]|uniref:Secreted protein n=1 Tax=Toxocara canis TaxID=6265 RepID=A0A183U8W7_TOXCA|nr:unnamed protein product [Toxocara canis]